MKKIFLAAFILVSFGELASELVDNNTLHLVCKPLIMVTLTLHYIFATPQRSVLAIAAMICSFLGDVLLMNDAYFIAGLVAFLAAHVFYIFVYRQHQFSGEGGTLTGVHRVRLAFPVVLAGSGLVVILYPVLGDLRIPVLIYAAVITTMTLVAMFRYGRTNAGSFWLVFLGAVCFMISDSVLAINKFLSPLALGGLWIMGTYIVAQFLIVRGLILHGRLSHE